MIGTLPRALLAAGLAAVLSGCISERPQPMEPPAEGGQPVAIRNFAFVPPDLTVRVGTPVVWTNEDDVVHTVTANDGSFDSDVFDKGQTFRLTPQRAGTFPYFCTIHPFMLGTLRVTE